VTEALRGMTALRVQARPVGLSYKIALVALAIRGKFFQELPRSVSTTSWSWRSATSPLQSCRGVSAPLLPPVEKLSVFESGHHRVVRDIPSIVLELFLISDDVVVPFPLPILAFPARQSV